MKQQQFEKLGAARWDRFESLLGALDDRRADAVTEFPPLYRRVCQDLALARDRQFSRPLVDRLNRLALQGHDRLYRARTGGVRQWIHFVVGDFPRAVRAEWRLLLFASLLFYGAGTGLAALIHQNGDLVYSFASAGQVAELEANYDPDQPRLGVARDAPGDVQMFGFYVWNNVSIAFRTFAAGLVFGVGTLAIVVFNSVWFGVVFGHLIRVGSAEPLFSFVVAHSAFELTAILLSAVAGARMGLALIAPGQRSRAQALREDARRALPLVYGAGGMLVLAAGIEAFWSPQPFSPVIKYTAGAFCWAFVLLYFSLAGRTRAD